MSFGRTETAFQASVLRSPLLGCSQIIQHQDICSGKGPWFTLLVSLTPHWADAGLAGHIEGTQWKLARNLLTDCGIWWGCLWSPHAMKATAGEFTVPRICLRMNSFLICGPESCFRKKTKQDQQHRFSLLSSLTLVSNYFTFNLFLLSYYVPDIVLYKITTTKNKI